MKTTGKRYVGGQAFLAQQRAAIVRNLFALALDPAAVQRAATAIEQDMRGALGGQVVFVPKLRAQDNAARAVRAGQLRASGQTIADIAARLGCSRSQVYRLLQQRRGNPS